MVFATEDIAAVNFVGRTAAANSPASVSATTAAEYAAVAMDSVVYAVGVENFAAIAAATKSIVDCAVDRVEAVNFAAGADEVTDAVDRVVGVMSCVGGAAVETSADRVAQRVNFVVAGTVTSVAECAVRTANVAPVLVYDAAAIAIAFESVGAAADTVDRANTGSCSANRVAFRD